MSHRTPDSNPHLSPNEVDAMFNGEIDRPRAGLWYQISAICVAAAILMLPVLYIGMIGAVGYLAYWHATHNLSLFNMAGRSITNLRVWILLLLLYVTPLGAAAILVVFMFKPFFAKLPERDFPLTVTDTDERALFAFVHRICDCLNAPYPHRIDINCEPNASASFRDGIIGFVRRDLVLTIGLPLVAGMPLQNLAEVIAHELGHFSQRFGMRQNYLIRRINHWFVRLVYERDHWDEWLADCSDDESYRGARLVFYAARFGVWLSRRLLWVITKLSIAISCIQLRQMEYHADQCALEVVGSDAFVKATRRIRLIAAAWGSVDSDMAFSWRQNRVADNLPMLVGARLADVSPEVEERIASEIELTRTRAFDTHPSDKDRITRAQAYAAQGIFSDPRPATLLFKNFSMLSAAVTLTYYRRTVGISVENQNLVPSAQFLKERTQQKKDDDALKSYLPFEISTHRRIYLKIDQLNSPDDARRHVARMRQAAEKLGGAAPGIAAKYERLKVLDKKAAQAKVAQALARAGLEFDPKPIDATEANSAAAEKAAMSAQAAAAPLAEKITAVEKVLRVRMISALELLTVPAVLKRIPNAGLLFDEAQRLVQVMSRLESLESVWACLAISTARLTSLIERGESIPDVEQSHPNWILVTRAEARQVAGHLREIRDRLSNCPFPFEHATSNMSVGAYACPKLQSPEEIMTTVTDGQEAFMRLGVVYHRVFARLATIAQKVETLLTSP
jgi:Zn-dependent protease with chaperone function